MDFSFATSNEKVRKAYRGPLPDIHHPKNYCCICDIFYSQKLVYTYHLRNVHNMDIPFDKSPGNFTYSCTKYAYLILHFLRCSYRY